MHGVTGSSKCKAVLLVVFGVLFLLGTTQVWPEFTFAKYWPLFLVVWGLHGVFCKCTAGAGKEGSCGCG